MFFTNKTKMATKIQRYTAFTLAEVLITLGIIGTIAAMVIPTVFADFKKIQYTAALKKTYTNLNHVISQILAEHDCAGHDFSCTGLFAYNPSLDADAKKIGSTFAQHFKVVKNCSNTDTASCFGTKKKNYDGGPESPVDNYLGPENYTFITADDTSFAIRGLSTASPDCSLSAGIPPIDRICGYITVDVNGLKPPNSMGRDVFLFMLTNSGVLYPSGGEKFDFIGLWWNGATKSCVDTNKEGDFCAGRIMEEGWQMNY